MVIVTPMAGFGDKLVEVASLDGVQPVGNAAQGCIIGRTNADARGRPLRVSKVAFQTAAIALIP